MTPAPKQTGRAPSRGRAALENLAFGWASTAFTIVQGILLVPFYLRAMPVELYGAWLATGNLLSWIELADPGIGAILQQRAGFAAGAQDRAALGRLVGTGMFLSGLLGLLPIALLPVSWTVGGFVRLTSAQAGQLAPAFALGLLSVTVNLLASGVTAVNVGLQRMRATGVIHLTAMLAGLGVTVGLLLAGYGLLSIPAGSLSRAGLAATGNTALLLGGAKRDGLRLQVSFAAARELFSVAAYTFVSRVGAVLLTKVDAFLCAHLLSPTAAVSLTLTGRVLDVVRMVADRVGIAAMPGLAHAAGQRGAAYAGEVALRVTRITALLAAVLAATVATWNQSLVSAWVGREHFGGVALTILLATYAVLGAVGGCMSQGVFALGGIREMSVLGLLEAAARLGTQLLVVPLLGLPGFPASALLAFALVNGPLLPIALARRAALARGTLYASLASSLALAAGLLAVGGLLASLPGMRADVGWHALLPVGALTGVGFAGAAALLARRTTGELVSALRRR